jgi:general secretion pathway protein K
MRTSQRGVALLIVLWGSTLAAIVLGALAINAHVEGLQARAQLDQAQAFYAAEAGLERAVFGLRLKDESLRWISDGRPYPMRIGDIDVRVDVMDDDGKINLNQADPALIGRLIAASGADPERASELVAALVRWGTADASAADKSPFLAAGGFSSIEELQRLPGMDQETYHRIEPALTLWQIGGNPNLAHASPAVIAAVSGISREQVSAFVKARSEWTGSSMAFPRLPQGVAAVMNVGPSNVLSITSRARLPDGVVSRLRATVRLTDEPGDRRTYRVLRWQVDAGT